MSRANQFFLKFIGLKDGSHKFEYDLDNGFFVSHDYSDFNSCDIKVKIELTKKTTVLELNIIGSGLANINCTLSNEPFDFEVNSKMKLLLKFGDLSGGQILKGIAKKALNPPEGEGLHFYDFPMIDDAKAFKTDYRAVLDGLEVNEHQVNTLITEANYAFRLNMYIFDELQGDAKKGLLKVLWGTITGK